MNVIITKTIKIIDVLRTTLIVLRKVLLIKMQSVIDIKRGH